ncbi:MAG TPA: hypothetical protein PKM63_08750 [Panacibacter sp.]|nr:hypothetical protein [Panacibacter sp.]HNP44357.1 hypothetical protein [Panacibacter sp.]
MDPAVQQVSNIVASHSCTASLWATGAEIKIGYANTGAGITTFYFQHQYAYLLYG